MYLHLSGHIVYDVLVHPDSRHNRGDLQQVLYKRRIYLEIYPKLIWNILIGQNNIWRQTVLDVISRAILSVRLMFFRCFFIHGTLHPGS